MKLALSERARRVLLVLGSTVVALMLGEIGARIVTRLHSDEAKRERDQLIASLPVHVGGGVYRPHPYFGYVLQSTREVAADADGFPNTHRYPSYRREPGEFVVGLFGGSVAAQIAGAPEAWLDRLKPAILAQGYTTVSLRTFAIAGWRQPQTFDAMAQVIADLDLVVCLDGFNEMQMISDANLMTGQATFPEDLIYAQLAGVSRPEDVLVQADLIRLHEAVRRVSAWLDRWPLRASVLAHAFWRLYARRYLKRAGELRDRLKTAINEQWTWRTPPVNESQILPKRDRYFELLGNLLRYSQAMADRKGVLFFEFIQPNLHDYGSKPLTAEEQQRVAVNRPQYVQIAELYRRLERMAAELRSEGVAIESLTQLFHDHHETVYIDDCCHFNRRGLEVMGAAIADRILASGKLQARHPRH
jgi:hypothetical protein